MKRIVVFALFLQSVGAQASNFTLSSLGLLISGCGAGWVCYTEACGVGSKYVCSYVAMFRDYNGMLEFVLSSKDNDYAALGFSLDQSMGGDEVLACLKLASGSVIADHYVNANYHAPSTHSTAQLLVPIGSFYENGQIGCRFTRPRQPSNTVDYYDMTRPHFHLYAYGPVYDNLISFHAPVLYPSTSTKAMSIVTASSNARSVMSPVLSLIVAFLMALAV